MVKEEFVVILEKHSYNRGASIKELQITPQMFYYYVKKFELVMPKFVKPKAHVINVARELKRQHLLREEAFEKRLYEVALHECDNNIARVAQHFGVTATTVHKKLRKHGIERERSNGHEKPLPQHLVDRICKDWSFMDDAIADYDPDLSV